MLEWDPVSLATAELRSLSLYRNGSKAGNIPRDKLSTKISGLAVDTEYTFHLVLRTSAGTYTSDKLTIKTQKMTDLTGITITPGVMPAQLREDLAATVERIGAKLIDTVRIDTTHFVCSEGRGQAWEKALEMNVPVVVPDWIKGCEREGRIVGVRGYYLNADPKLRQVGPGAANQSQSSLSAQQQQPPAPGIERRPSNLSQQSQQLRVQPPMSSPRIEHTPPTPERIHAEEVQTNGADVPPTPPPKHQPDSSGPSEPAAVPEPAPTSAPQPEPITLPDAATSAPQEDEVTGLGLTNTSPTEQAQESAHPSHSDVSRLQAEESTIRRAHTPEISPRSQLPPKFEPFHPSPPQQTTAQEEAEKAGGEGEKTVEKEEENNLKAIGIPHAESPAPSVAATTKTTADEEEGEGFDEVAL